MHAKQKIHKVIADMLSGDMPYLDGATALCQLQHDVGAGDSDPDFLVFIAIDLETDSLPRSQLHEYWNAEALRKLMPEIESAERWAQSISAKECPNLLKRFSGE